MKPSVAVAEGEEVVVVMRVVLWVVDVVEVGEVGLWLLLVLVVVDVDARLEIELEVELTVVANLTELERLELELDARFPDPPLPRLLYIFKRDLPPQYSSGLALHAISHVFPLVEIALPALTVFPQ